MLAVVWCSFLSLPFFSFVGQIACGTLLFTPILSLQAAEAAKQRAFSSLRSIQDLQDSSKETEFGECG